MYINQAEAFINIPQDSIPPQKDRSTWSLSACIESSQDAVLLLFPGLDEGSSTHRKEYIEETLPSIKSKSLAFSS